MSPQRATSGLAEAGPGHWSLSEGRHSELSAQGRRDEKLVWSSGGCGLRSQLHTELPSWRYQVAPGPSCPALRRSAELRPCMRL